MDRRLVVAPRFGHWLKLLRTFAAIEQLDVAAMADISVGQVRALERGENVGLAYAEALIGAYRIVAEKDNNHELLQALDHEAFVAMAKDASKSTPKIAVRSPKQRLRERG